MSAAFLSGVAPAPGLRTGLLLVNLGTPNAATGPAVRRYLAEFLHDYRVVELSRWLWCPLLHGVILPLRSRKLARSYAGIWTEQGSPLLAHSRDLTQALQAQLPEFEVALAMRYGRPSVADALREWRTQGLQRLLVLPVYPQYSASTTASAHDAVMAELGRWRCLPELRWINGYHDDDGWLDALQASVENHWDLHGRGDKLLLSFHGLPQRFIDAGDPYARQCEIGAGKLAERLRLGPDDWCLSYQSRFGRDAWLRPYTDKTLLALAAEGAKTVDMICPGFAVDCLETLDENAVRNVALFRRAGGTLRYIPALNATVGHVAALAGLARRHAQGWPH
jgi:ferrochelatase